MQLAKRIIPAIFFYLACAFVTFAQSTTVSGTVTDLGAQAWANGPYKFIFTPNPQFPTGPYAWTGGALNNVITGTLDGSGHYSVSIPSNSAITPAGSTWVLQITPDATSQSFSTLATTITGATQTLNATPPAILISWGIPPGPAISAYADGEIGGTLPKGAEYFNVTSSLTRVWNGSSWADQGSGAGGSVSGSGTTGFIPAWTGASSLGNSHCNDGVTTASTVTCAENFAVTGGFNIVMGGGTLFTGTVEGTVADNGLDLFCDPSGGACTVNVGENTANENVAIQGVGLTVTTSAGAVVNGATGGAKGAGTVNALGLFVNGVAISAGGTCPSGAAGSIQFTDGTNCASDANFTWNSTTHSLIAQGVNAASKIASGTGFGNNLTIGATSVVLQAGVGTATMALTSDAVMTITSNNASIALVPATGVTVGSPTGGAEGVGTLNAQGLFVNGVAVSTTPLSGLTTGVIPQAGSATTLVNSSPQLDNGVTAANTLTYAGSGGFVTPKLTCGVLNTTSCVIQGFGGTSGSWTITGPLVAGTTTNALLFSNAIKLPAGNAANTAIQFADGVNYGFFDGAGNIIAVANGHDAMAWRDVDISAMPSQGNLGWTGTSGDPTAALDTNLTRISAGVVGAGTGAAASVAGTFSAAHFTGGGNAGVTAGSFSAVTAIATTGGIVTTLTGTSDARLKMNVHPYLRGLDAVLKLNPKTYQWNEKGQEITKFNANARQAGFIAQNVREAIPEAIGSEAHDGTDYLTFSDRPVLAALVNAIKEQQKEIAKLQREISGKQ